ncbi:MAG: DNA polymerase I, partial [Lachnospiraceae bacterium]|nr:DNA polymerase I [Lachnospiraceae bacterium]
AKNHGYVTTILGRRRPVPELKSANYMQRQFGERVAMNSPVQGSAADIMKLAMLAVTRALKDGGYSSRVVLQIHDELLLEVPAAEVEAVTRLLRETMTGVIKLGVPLEVGIETGSSWFETK